MVCKEEAQQGIVQHADLPYVSEIAHVRCQYLRRNRSRTYTGYAAAGSCV